jgi:hypothetical protein
MVKFEYTNKVIVLIPSNMYPTDEQLEKLVDALETLGLDDDYDITIKENS